MSTPGPHTATSNIHRRVGESGARGTSRRTGTALQAQVVGLTGVTALRRSPDCVERDVAVPGGCGGDARSAAWGDASSSSRTCLAARDRQSHARLSLGHNDSDLPKHQSCSTVIKFTPEGSAGAWGCLHAMAALNSGPWPPHAPLVSCCTGGLARSRHLHARV